MRHDRAGDAGAVDMRTLLAAKCIERGCDRVRKFGVVDVNSGIDHGNGNVGAMGQRMCLGQSKFRDRILRRIALGQFRLLLLQDIAEVRLHRANAGLGGEFTAHRLYRAAIGNPEQTDSAADEREILRLQAREAVTPRQFIGLRVGSRAVDLGHEFVGDGV